MTSASLIPALEYLSVLLNIAAVLRVVHSGLYRVYPFFFSFLTVSLTLELAAAVAGTKSRLFFYTYVSLEPLRNVLYILVVWELFSVIFRNYAGLRSLSRWVMGAAAAIAPIGFVISLAAHGSVYASYSRFVSNVVQFERGVSMGLVVFILIMLYFISRYPIKLPRNSVVLCLFYSVWFLIDAMVLLASSFLPRASGRVIVNVTQALLEICCYFSWAWLLSRAGEFQETRVRRDIAPDVEESLIQELNAMNQMLLRAGRSISQSRQHR
ncbi:MAG TPA: hypothetical protein VGL72_06180 [Bryobacteraceae bacterium]|jgi:hypothetical protein